MRGKVHSCPSWDGAVIFPDTEAMEQCMCQPGDVVAEIDPFCTHVVYRGERFKIDDVVRAVRMLPTLKVLGRLMQDGPATPTKPTRKRR